MGNGCAPASYKVRFQRLLCGWDQALPIGSTNQPRVPTSVHDRSISWTRSFDARPGIARICRLTFNHGRKVASAYSLGSFMMRCEGSVKGSCQETRSHDCWERDRSGLDAGRSCAHDSLLGSSLLDSVGVTWFQTMNPNMPKDFG